MLEDDLDPWYVAGDNETHCAYCFRTWRPGGYYDQNGEYHNITEKERPDIYHDWSCFVMVRRREE